MSKIEWDKFGEHWIETGTDHGVLYTMKTDGTYNNGVAWNGLTGVDENPEGADPNDFYADDIKYASVRSSERFKYTIKAYSHPDEFYECDGSAEIGDGVYIGQQDRNGFGFSYRSKLANDTASSSDDAYKLHIYYNSTATPSSRSYQTINENPDAIEFSWDCDTIPVNVTGHKPVSSISIDSRYIAADKLKAIEDLLYGTADKAPTLPSPDEIIALLKTGD